MSGVGLDTRICSWCEQVRGDCRHGFTCSVSGESKQRYDTCAEWQRVTGRFA